jgi:mono/diheme cytochrome c family protein
VPGEERNIEEVFKNYRYYAIVYSQDGSRLSVTEYVQGKAKNIIDYQRDAHGRLLPQGQDAASGTDPDGATASLYASLCAVCHAADRLGGSGPALLENLPEGNICSGV